MKKMEKMLKFLKWMLVVLYAICVVCGFVEVAAEYSLLLACAFAGFNVAILVLICIGGIESADEDRKIREILESED